MTTKDDLYRLIDGLDETDARLALERLQDLQLPRVLRDAPIDDEPVTDEDLAAIAEAEADIAAGRVVSDQEIRREFSR
jgi:predicted transcriptional regulator